MRRERNKEKREKIKFKVIQHTIYVPTSTATLRELLLLAHIKAYKVSLYITLIRHKFLQIK